MVGNETCDIRTLRPWRLRVRQGVSVREEAVRVDQIQQAYGRCADLPYGFDDGLADARAYVRFRVSEIHIWYDLPARLGEEEYVQQYAAYLRERGYVDPAEAIINAVAHIPPQAKVRERERAEWEALTPAEKEERRLAAEVERRERQRQEEEENAERRRLKKERREREWQEYLAELRLAPAKSDTAWRKDGYRVREGERPAGQRRFTPRGMRKSISYDVYLPEQVEPIT
jgi:hypothetical protein